MQNFVQKISDFFKKVVSTENLNKVKVFGKKNRKYFLAVLLFILLAVVVTQCTGNNKGDVSNTQQSSELGEPTNAEDFVLDAEFKTEENQELNTLISSYFTAYAADDLDALAALAYPMTDNEKSYIGVFSQYIESYQNIKCYYKEGLSKGSYLVSVYYELKFHGVETLAPGLDFFYVETNEEGKLFINNLYSSYNMGRTEKELDPNIYVVILKFEQQEDVVALLQQVETKYKEAVASDVNLVTMVSTTIPTAMTQWIESISQMEETEQTTQQEQPAESTTQQEQPAESTTQQEQPAESTTQQEQPVEQTPQQVRTTTKVFVRIGPGTEYSYHGKVEAGAVFTKLGDEGEWVKVDYNGAEGYIHSDFVENVTN